MLGVQALGAYALGQQSVAPTALRARIGGYDDAKTGRKRKKLVFPYIEAPQEAKIIPQKVLRKARAQNAARVVLRAPTFTPAPPPLTDADLRSVTKELAEAWIAGAKAHEVAAEVAFGKLYAAAGLEVMLAEALAEETLWAEAERLGPIGKERNVKEEEFLVNFAWSTYFDD